MVLGWEAVELVLGWEAVELVLGWEAVGLVALSQALLVLGLGVVGGSALGSGWVVDLKG